MGLPWFGNKVSAELEVEAAVSGRLCFGESIANKDAWCGLTGSGDFLGDAGGLSAANSLLALSDGASTRACGTGVTVVNPPSSLASASSSRLSSSARPVGTASSSCRKTLRFPNSRVIPAWFSLPADVSCSSSCLCTKRWKRLSRAVWSRE